MTNDLRNLGVIIMMLGLLEISRVLNSSLGAGIIYVIGGVYWMLLAKYGD